ncbi:hypothetical protein [Acinetobacter junii]|uniref:hypothetical protein n=1 Tax=Acinetobacter junii TaxID=40215 RepID=UPI00124FCDEC|nr:hypothetical protein [Acinetobacter junii]
MHTATAICSIQQSIRYRDYKSLMSELRLFWGDLGTFSNHEEALKNADESFYKELKPILESLKGFDHSDWSIRTKLIQQYLYEHPVRSQLLKHLIAEKQNATMIAPIRMEVSETMLVNFIPVDDSIVRKIDF